MKSRWSDIPLSLKAQALLSTIEEEYLDSNGVCLTNEIVGTGVFIYGNTMLSPSPLITEVSF